MRDDDLESRIRDFEQAWRLAGPCDFAAFLARPPELGEERRARLLVELICVDMELRGKGLRGSKPTLTWVPLETYAAWYPELGSLDQLPIEVIGQEYRVRSQWGDRPTHSDFLSRFTARREQIQAELERIDRELRDEWASPRGPMPPVAAAIVHGTESGKLGDVPLLSHKDVLLKRMIGAGRVGKVYEAWQHSMGRPVAVKFLRKSFLQEPAVVRRFIDEAGTIARLRHPHIVGIHGFGRTPGGGYFILMELAAGSSLDRVIAGGVVPVERAVRWAIELCQGLEHAHALGIIHCDLKPANLLLESDGRLRVTDFGLARNLAGHTDWTAEVEGTVPFMAPEQASRCWGQIDVRTDVYGVGAVLFTLLTGRPPWVGRRLPDILADVVRAAPVIPPTSLRPDLPESLSDICRKCLSKAPEDRYQTVREVRTALIEMSAATADRLGRAPVGRGLLAMFLVAISEKISAIWHGGDQLGNVPMRGGRNAGQSARITHTETQGAAAHDRHFCRAPLVLAAGDPGQAETGPNAGPLRYTTSWVGNTFGGGPRWVQNAAESMQVLPDGTLVVGSFWDEGGREVGLYKDGDVVGQLPDTHMRAGFAVAANDRYVFYAHTCALENQPEARAGEARREKPIC